MSDLFGYTEERPPFVDIRKQRELLCRKAPKSLAGASINRVREWQAAHKIALKTLQSKGSSRTELSSAINSLRAF